MVVVSKYIYLLHINALFYTAARAFKFHSLSLGFISIYIFESGTTLLLRNRIIDAPFHDELWFAVVELKRTNKATFTLVNF